MIDAKNVSILIVCWGVGKIYSSGKRDTIRPPYPLCFLKKTRKMI